jgi:hypothetical protein
VANEYKDKQIEGLEILGVLSEDAQGGVPTLDYCKQYAEAAGFPPEKMIIDNGFEKLFAVMANGGNGGIGLPWDGVLNGNGMIYIYNSEQGQTSPASAVEDLLSDAL